MGYLGNAAFDIFTLISSYLSPTVISAQTIMRTLGLMTFMIPVAISMSSGILLGQYIGSGQVGLVRHYHHLSMVFAVIAALFQNVILFTLKD
jgi:MATE family multidrug resistance protein